MVAPVHFVQKMSLHQQHDFGELMDVKRLDRLRVQEKPLFLQMGKAAHRVDLAVLQQVQKDGRTGRVQKTLLLDKQVLFRCF